MIICKGHPRCSTFQQSEVYQYQGRFHVPHQWYLGKRGVCIPIPLPYKGFIWVLPINLFLLFDSLKTNWDVPFSLVYSLGYAHALITFARVWRLVILGLISRNRVQLNYNCFTLDAYFWIHNPVRRVIWIRVFWDGWWV